jgi:hypothetical protein
VEKVDPDLPVQKYSDGPLRALQSKLSISDINFNSDEKSFPNSFMNFEKSPHSGMLKTCNF